MSPNSRPISVAVVGLGATGSAIAAEILADDSFELLTCVDTSSARSGYRLKDMGDARLDSELEIVGEIERIDPRVTVVVEATRSRLHECLPNFHAVLERGMNVVSSCEELSFPFRVDEAAAAELDRLASDNQSSILGTGLNPGLLMDALPIVLSGAFRRLERIEVHRVLDMRGYDVEVLSRFGLGLAPEEFNSLRVAGRLAGHVGFEQSLAQLSEALGLNVDITPGEVAIAVVSSSTRSGKFASLAPGTVAVTSDGASAAVGSELVLDVRASFGFLEASDPVEPGDRLQITADGRRYELRSSEGLPSIPSTAAMVVNMIEPILESPPGLRTMKDFQLGSVASKPIRAKGARG